MRSRRETAKAKAILETVFAESAGNFNVHLWNGSILRIGQEKSEFRLFLLDKQAFKRIFWHPDPLRFGKAYARKEIDIMGAPEKALEIIQSLEPRRSFWKRMQLKVWVMTL